MWLEARGSVRLANVIVIAVLAIACRPPGYGKGDDTDPNPAADAPTSETDAPASSDGPTALTCNKAFRLDGHATASSVWLTGSFVAWGGDPAHGAIELVLGVDGAWTGSRDFTAGQHQYKFIVDGTSWINDPTNPDQVDDGFGGTNSVFTCVP